MHKINFRAPERRLTYVFTRASSTTTTCRWGSDLTIRSLGVFLFYMCIESWITQIGLWAEVAFEITPFHVVLGATLAFSTTLILTTVVIIAVVVFAAVSLLSLTCAAHVLQLCLIFTDCADHMWYSRIAGRKLARAWLSVRHHILSGLVNVSHLKHLIGPRAVAIGPPIGLLLV